MHVSHAVPVAHALYIVRDLPGHTSVAMSLRCARFAPDQRCGAVARLGQRPMCSLGVRIPYTCALRKSASELRRRATNAYWRTGSVVQVSHK